MHIDESLKNLREKLNRRREQIQSFLQEQENLCIGKLTLLNLAFGSSSSNFSFQN